MNEARMRTVLLVAAVYHLLLGAYMFFAPASFYDTLGEFPPENHHYIKDVSTFYIALGIAFYISARSRSWRVPILAFAALEYALHTLNHLIDVGDALSSGKGWFAVFSLALLTGLLLFVLAAAGRGVRDRVEAEPEPPREE